MQVLLRRKYGLHINHKRVYRLLRELGLQAVIRRKQRYPRFFGGKGHRVAANVLNREFVAPAPNQKWATDITYLRVGGRQYYLSVLLDLFNKEVVGYQLSTMMDAQMVMATVEPALRARATDGLLIHSDQGMQYATQAYQRLLRRYGVTQSMSRRGNCLDNACIEGFFGHLKSEWQPERLTVDAPTLAMLIDQYIHFYNHERYQQGLRDRAPVEYRASFEARGIS
jgi:putative transposase